MSLVKSTGPSETNELCDSSNVSDRNDDSDNSAEFFVCCIRKRKELLSEQNKYPLLELNLRSQSFDVVDHSICSINLI